MSKLVPQEKYEKTKAFHFWRWLSGTKDPYLDHVEMKEQKEWKEEEQTIQDRMNERQMIHDAVYDMGRNKKQRLFHGIYVAVAIIFWFLLLVILLYTVSNLPPTGSPEKAVNNEVPERYIEKGLQETGAVNIVTDMILDSRAFDTFGESNVLFIATVTVLILLHYTKKDAAAKKEEANDRAFEPKNDTILQVCATILVPIIILFGIYVILNGHISPGGGFSGGAIIGAGLILHVSAFGFVKTEKFFTEKTYKIICFVALTFYCLAKSYSFFTGANHLESHIPLGTPGAILSSGLILPLNICVGLVVACTMYTFYAMFRKGDF